MTEQAEITTTWTAPTELDAVPAGVSIISPCVSICEMDVERGICKGCLRTAEEIGTWRFATPEQRAAILIALRARIPQVEPEISTKSLDDRLRIAGV